MSERRPMFDVVHKFFADSSWVTTQFVGKPILRFAHSGKNGQWVCIAHCRESESRFVFYSIGLAAVPEETRPALALFLTRANFGLIIGNFEMDMSDGEVRYKTSIDVEDDRLSTTLLRHLVDVNIEMMDKYLPGMRAVVEDGADPEAAVIAVEGIIEPRFEG